MKSRKEITKWVYNTPTVYNSKNAMQERRKDMVLEVLLDIRELLIVRTPDQQLRRLK